MEIGGFRIDVVERRQVVHVAVDAHLAEAGQITQEEGLLHCPSNRGRGVLEGHVKCGDFSGCFIFAAEAVEGEGIAGSPVIARRGTGPVQRPSEPAWLQRRRCRGAGISPLASASSSLTSRSNDFRRHFRRRARR